MDGYEVTVEFEDRSCYESNKEFYTDANGFEMQKRTQNYRPTWNIEDNYNDSL
jgi:hypothetical protein